MPRPTPKPPTKARKVTRPVVVPPPKPGEQAIADTRRWSVGTHGPQTFPYNPDAWLQRKGLQIVEEMLDDDQVMACTWITKAAILGPGWQIEPHEDSDAEKDLGNAVKAALDDADFDDTLTDLLTALSFGFCLDGDTLIHTPSGDIPIRALVGKQPWVFSCVNGETRLARASRVWLTQRAAECVRVKFSWHAAARPKTGEIVCTASHPFLLVDGTYRRAGDLRPDDRLAPFSQTAKLVGAVGHKKRRVHLQTRWKRGRGQGDQGSQWVRRWRWVWEQAHGCPVPEGHAIHHLDGDTLNDDPSNLTALPGPEHTAHHTREWFAEAGADRLAQRNARTQATRATWTDEERAARSERQREANRQTWADPEVRAKRIAGMTGNVLTPEQRANIAASARASWTPERMAKWKAARWPTVVNHRVEVVEPAGKRDVYDMEVPGTHNFAAGTVFVHNSIAEAVWDVAPSSGLYLKAVKGRAPHNIDFDQDAYGNLRSILQQQGSERKVMDPARFIHFAPISEFDNLYGRSLYRSAHRPWWYKKNVAQWWAMYLEKLAIPIPVGKHTSAGNAQAEAVLAILKNLQAGTAMTVGEGWEVDLLQSQTDVKAVFEGAVNRFDLSIARGMLTPEKLGYAGGETDKGSYSLSQTHFDVWMFVIELFRKRLVKAVQRQLIASLAGVLDPATPAPRFRLLPLNEDNKERLAELWIQAVTNGVALTTLQDENHLRKNLLNFPERTEAADADEAPRGGALEIGGVPAPPTPEETALEIAKAKALGAKPNPAQFAEAPDATPWRPLTPAETRADVDATVRTIDALSLDAGAKIAVATADLVRDLIRRAEKATTGVLVRTLDVQAAKQAAVNRAVKEALQAAYTVGEQRAASEVARMPRQQVTFSEHVEATLVTLQQRGGLVGAEAQRFFANKSLFVTGTLVDDILKRAKLVLFNALKQDKTPGQTQYELDQALGDYLPDRDAIGRVVNVPHRIETIARTNIAEAVNEGRWATFTDPSLDGFITLLRYSAVMDSRTRDTHRAWDGVTLPPNHPAWHTPSDNRPPAGFNCRCVLVPISAGDAEAVQTSDDAIPRVPASDPGFR